jgi:hypothetical protein
MPCIQCYIPIMSSVGIDACANRTRGCVPLQGMVGCGASVRDLHLPTRPELRNMVPGGVPTYPSRITEHGAAAGTYLPLQNYGTCI